MGHIKRVIENDFGEKRNKKFVPTQALRKMDRRRVGRICSCGNLIAFMDSLSEKVPDIFQWTSQRAHLTFAANFFLECCYAYD